MFERSRGKRTWAARELVFCVKKYCGFRKRKSSYFFSMAKRQNPSRQLKSFSHSALKHHIPRVLLPKKIQQKPEFCKFTSEQLILCSLDFCELWWLGALSRNVQKLGRKLWDAGKKKWGRTHQRGAGEAQRHANDGGRPSFFLPSLGPAIFFPIFVWAGILQAST